MRTAIVSDLHLGSATGEDLLSDPTIRRALLEEIAVADRLVLLGDVLELRELPLARVLELTAPFFEALGEAMAGRRIVLLPGNHDHRLAEPLLEEVALAGGELGLEHRATLAGEPMRRIAAWLGEAELSVAYPGIWLRDDVYATHGHYMDCHMSLPRLECLAAAAVMRAAGKPPATAAPRDYERILRPIYGLFFGLAEAGLRPGASRPSERAWRAFTSTRSQNRLRRALAKAALGAGMPTGMWLINRTLRAGFDPDLSATAITRSGIDAATELVRRLGLDAAHTITGHTHRGGPEAGDGAWPLPGGGQLHNTGNWVFADAFHHPGAPPGPYWPGSVTWIEDNGPPRRTRLLLDRTHAELSATVERLAASRLRATRR
jgi:hypothetical protein